MSSNFLSLPRELREQIYELVLLHQEPVLPNGPEYGSGHHLTPGLFRVNKTINHEATSLFYSQNCFDFAATSADIVLEIDDLLAKEIAKFLEQIGPLNASYIRHMRIDFPKFLYREPNNYALEDDSLENLTKIQSYCANLITLTISASSTYCIKGMAIRLDTLEYGKVETTEVLRLVNTYFKAMSSLQEIIVELYEGDPNELVQRTVERQGWVIRIVEWKEEAYYADR